jgi:hypothetical protein
VLRPGSKVEVVQAARARMRGKVKWVVFIANVINDE